MIDRVDMSDPGAVVASHDALLDPSTAQGAVAASCVGDYCERLGLNPDVFPLLRLRGWIAKATPDDAAAASFARLAAEELRRLEPTPPRPNQAR
jgi:hypothetical protein